MTAWKARGWLTHLGCMLACLAFTPAGVLAAQEKDLSGAWVIDRNESEDPAEVLETLTRRTAAGAGVGVGVGIFGVPVEVARTTSGRAPAEVVQRDLRRLPRHLIDGVARLDIEQSPGTLRVTYDDLGTVVYRTGTTEGVEDTTLAEWRRDVYTVVRHIGADLLATEEIYLDRQDPSRLRWKVSLEFSTRRAVQIDRVYDRAP